MSKSRQSSKSNKTSHKTQESQHPRVNHFELGWILIREKKHADAIVAFNKCHNANDTKIQIQIARCYRAMHDDEKALHILNKLLERELSDKVKIKIYITINNEIY